jgi:hypothetical protein
MNWKRCGREWSILLQVPAQYLAGGSEEIKEKPVNVNSSTTET